MAGSVRGPNDPHRRERILDAALDVVAEVGAIKVTYRRIAAAAGVPLGSLTYYFDDMQQLLTEAFTRLAESVAARYGGLLEAAGTREEAREAVVEIICGKVWGNDRDLLLSYELYAFAARHPEVRGVMRRWMQSSRDALERHFDPMAARTLDALVEGFSIHNSVDVEPAGREAVAAAVEAVTAHDFATGAHKDAPR